MTYEPIARLGRGGMGVVDLARGPEGNQVALKRLTLTGSANEILRARQRLLREAEVLRRLHHPNVLRLLDVIDEGDEIVLVMPYMSGGSLAERVAQHGPAPADEVERQARRLFGALSQAHQLGIIHRDIKPANILFDDRGEPCLADFGVAQTWDQTHGLTVAGMVVGTPGFMAPEQARGEQAVPASDVFSLGATLLFAATGEGPFGPGDPAVLMVRAAGNKVNKVPRTLPLSLRRLLSDSLAVKPERRPTAAAVVGSPHGLMAGLPAVARPQSGLSWAIVGALVAAVLVMVGALVVSDRDQQNADGDGLGTDSLPGFPDPEDATGSEAPGAPGSGTAPGASVPSEAPGSAPPNCTARPYQPCGQGPAPNTDGTRCINDHADYDGDATNGCEVAPDTVDGAALRLPQDALEASIVPSGDSDTYSLTVDEGDARCPESLILSLEAPEGMDLYLEVTMLDETVNDVVVRGGQAGALTLRDPCHPLGSDRAPQGTPYKVTVSADGLGRSPQNYVLQLRNG